MKRSYPNTLGWRPDASMIETQERVCEHVFRTDHAMPDGELLIQSSIPKRVTRSMDYEWTVTVEVA